MPSHANTTSEQRKAFAVALEVAMAACGIRSAAELHRRGVAAGIDKTPSAFTHWTTGRSEPSRPEVLILETICGLEPGQLSCHLGWLPLGITEQLTIEQVVLADPAISDANKAILLGLISQLRD